MYSVLIPLLSWLLSPALSSNTSPTTTIEGRLQFPDKTAFNVTTRIALNHDEFWTYSREDGTFTIYNVKPGIHVLDVHSLTHHFPQIKIQLLEEDMDHPRCLEYMYPGAQKKPASYPLVLTTYASYDYFEIRRGFSLFSILKNPMVLMMVISVGLMLAMPKLMEGLEPEERERMKKQMEMQQDPTKMLSSFLSGFKEEETPKNKKIKK